MYRFSRKEHTVEFYGPGMPQHANYPLDDISDATAERLAQWLAKAYEAGRKAKAEELRRALNCYEPW